MTDTSTKLGKIFIGGLSYETTDEKLRQYFSAYGEVTDAVVMKDPISRRSRGFGFITYSDPVCVDRALAQPNHILDSRRVEAKRAVPRAESTKDLTSTNSVTAIASSATNSLNSSSGSILGSITNPSNVSGLSNSSTSRNLPRSNVSSVIKASGSPNSVATKKIFVGGLHYETKDADFKKYFEQFGKVVSAEVMFNRETNKSRGFGFVVFEIENSVEHVLQNRNHIIDGKSVEVKRAVPRTDAPPAKASTKNAVNSNPHGMNVNPSVVNSSIGRNLGSISGGGTSADAGRSYSNEEQQQQQNQPRSFAAVANGTLGGYAAAVRYGGKVPPTNSTQSVQKITHSNSTEENNNFLSERMNNVSINDPSSYYDNDLRVQQDYSQEHSLSTSSPQNSNDLSRGSSPHINNHSNLQKSPSSPSKSISLSPPGNTKWPSYNNKNEISQYGVSGQNIDEHHQIQQSQPPPASASFQWHQPQWTQWGQSSFSSKDIGQSSSNASEESSNVPQSAFFSMFSSESSPSSNAPSSSKNNNGSSNSNFGRSSWESSYNHPSLGMGGIGMMGSTQMNGMGIGMDDMGLGIGALQAGMTDNSVGYGGFGSGSLGNLSSDYHASMGLNSNGSISNRGLMKPEQKTLSDPQHKQQQQSIDSIGLDYNAYNSNSAPNSQYQTYR